jgi:hypothetical protein
VNHALLAIINPAQVAVEICRADELDQRHGLSSELDEMWSFVARKSNPRWLWHAIDERMHDLVIGLFINRYEFGRLL